MRQAAANLPDNNVWLMLSHSAHKHIKGEILKEFRLDLQYGYIIYICGCGRNLTF